MDSNACDGIKKVVFKYMKGEHREESNGTLLYAVPLLV
jgi:hypothetical protein